MRSLDRFWWLRLVQAFAYVLAVPCFVLWYLRYIVPYDLRYRPVAVSDAFLAGFIACALLTLALRAVLAIRLERQRDELRAAALAGGQDALPLARAALVDVYANTPRVIDVSYPRPWRLISGQILNLAFPLGFLIFFGDDLLAVILLPFGIQVPIPDSSSPRQRTVPGEYPFLFALLISVGLCLVAAYFVQDQLREWRFQTSRIRITEEGIERFSPFGRRRFLAWHDARLLEASSRRYALYGDGTVVRWEEQVMRSGILPRGFWQIAPAVRLHTGLRPRTLDPSMLAPGASLSLTRLNNIVTRLPLWLGVVAIVTGLAVAAAPDHGEIAVGVAILGGVALVWLIGWGETRKAVIERAYESQLAGTVERPSLNSGAVYEMTVGSYQAFVINQVMFVILGLLAIGFSLFVLGALFAEFVLKVPGLHLYPLPLFVLPVLVGIMTLGVITIVLAVRARDTVVLADAAGLRKRWVMGNTFLPWGDVDRVERHRIYGVQVYVVYERNGRTRITWPRRYFVPSLSSQERGAILLDPDGMAALIAEQIGQGIQVRG